MCESSYLTSDLIICPVNDDSFSIESLKLTIEDIEESCDEYEANKPDIRVLKNRFSSDRRRRAGKDAEAELNREFAEIILPIHIRSGTCIKNTVNDGISIFDRSIKDKQIEDIRLSFNELLSTVYSQ